MHQIILALLMPGMVPAAYALVFVFLGAMLSGMRIGYNNFVLEMASPEMRATCVALQNTLIAPITLFPLVAGVLIQELSFSLIFGSAIILLGLGLLISLRLLDPRNNPAGVCDEKLGKGTVG